MAGHTTHGTACAAEYYATQFSKNLLEYLFLNNIALVVECTIKNNTLIDIKKIREYNW